MILDLEILLDPDVSEVALRRLARWLCIRHVEGLSRKALARAVWRRMEMLRRQAAGTLPSMLGPRPRQAKMNLALPLVAPGPQGKPEALADGANVCPACRRPIREIEDHDGWCVEGLRAVAALHD